MTYPSSQAGAIHHSLSGSPKNLLSTSRGGDLTGSLWEIKKVLSSGLLRAILAPPSKEKSRSAKEAIAAKYGGGIVCGGEHRWRTFREKEASCRGRKWMPNLVTDIADDIRSSFLP